MKLIRELRRNKENTEAEKQEWFTRKKTSTAVETQQRKDEKTSTVIKVVIKRWKPTKETTAKGPKKE